MAQEQCRYKTSIGGQALIEGIMMKGPEKSAMAVRTPSGEIDLEVWDNPGGKLKKVKKIPFVRGIFNLVDSLVTGYRCLMKSAEKAGMEEEPSPFEKKMNEKFGKAFTVVFNGVILCLSVAIALGLFMFLPALFVKLIGGGISSSLARTALEGVIKILIFLLYLFLVTRMKDIRRVFEYHGGEHKSIACYEAMEELTVENVRKHTRFHPRCGTSFMLLVLIISILVTSVVTWDSLLIRVLLKVALLPVVVGISYELIKYAGRHDNLATKIISAPGLWLQRLTAFEPDDSQMEVAITALKAVIPAEAGADKW